jgi:hypothetical protein
VLAGAVSVVVIVSQHPNAGGRPHCVVRRQQDHLDRDRVEFKVGCSKSHFVVKVGGSFAGAE